jgi:hypothetical protein
MALDGDPETSLQHLPLAALIVCLSPKIGLAAAITKKP